MDPIAGLAAVRENARNEIVLLNHASSNLAAV
jgi:hypothetical protein